MHLESVQFSRSVVSDSLRPHESPGLPVHHQLPEVTQTHVHRIIDAIQPSHPLSSPSPPAPNPSQQKNRVFSNESTFHMRWPKYWSFSFSIIPSKVSPELIYNTKTPTTDVCRKIYRINCKGYIVIDIGYSNSVVWAAAESWITDLQAGKKVTIHLLIGSFNIHGYYCLRARWGLEGRSFCI